MILQKSDGLSSTPGSTNRLLIFLYFEFKASNFVLQPSDVALNLDPVSSFLSLLTLFRSLRFFLLAINKI